MKESKIYEGQLSRGIAQLNLEPFRGSTVFVSGGKGMIGACLLDLLSHWNRHHEGNIHLIASTRNVDGTEVDSAVQWISWDSHQPLVFPHGTPPIDYIIHTASHADPVNFAKYPVDTLQGTITGTGHILDYALLEQLKRVIYLSSGEMYGQPEKDGQGYLKAFSEDFCGKLDHSNPRACYPVGKRGAEVLCQSYIRQYGLDVVIARLCHIFGPTMKESDSRASSEFLKNATAGKDIIMKSAGQLERSHCYVVDCVVALLLLLERGVSGEAYNVADATYQMTIREFAVKTAQYGGVNLVFERPSDMEAKGYSQVSRAVLTEDKIRALGWQPNTTEKKGSAIGDTVEILRKSGLS